MIGKFKNAQALWHSYECLEKAFTQKCQQIKQMENEHKRVFELKVEWATNDDSGCTTEIYATADKASTAFDTEVIQAMEDYGVFDNTTGELADGWVMDKGNGFWELWEDGYYTSNHCLITVTEKAVH